jgi:hypothetical protein
VNAASFQASIAAAVLFCLAPGPMPAVPPQGGAAVGDEAVAWAWLARDDGPAARVTMTARVLPGAAEEASAVEAGNPGTRIPAEAVPEWRRAVRSAASWLEAAHPGTLGKGRRVDVGLDVAGSGDAAVHLRDVPQAALALALALDALAGGRARDPGVAVTGGLEVPAGEPGFRLAPAPGIGRKVREARGQLRALVVPAGNREDLADVLVGEGTRPWLGVQVFVAEDVEGAERITRAPDEREGFLNEAMRLFDEVRTLAGGDPVDERFRQRELYERLRRIVEMEPGHVSARMLLAVADGRVPARFSLGGSLRVLEAGGRALELEDRDALTAAEFALRKERPRLAEEVQPTWDALHARVEIRKRMADARARGNPSALADLRSRLREAEQRHARNAAFLDALPEVREARARLALEP